jgi:hypothetical protein
METFLLQATVKHLSIASIQRAMTPSAYATIGPEKACCRDEGVVRVFYNICAYVYAQTASPACLLALNASTTLAAKSGRMLG